MPFKETTHPISQKFNALEQLDQKELGRHEREVLRRVNEFGAPIMRAVRRRWGRDKMLDGTDRGWMVCSPTSIIASRILNATIDGVSGPPIKLDGNPQTEEYLHLPDLIYDPRRIGGRDEDLSDHVLIFYHTGKGDTYIIDFVYNPLWGNKAQRELTEESSDDDLRDSIVLDKVPTHKLYARLEEKYHLYPFTTYEDGRGREFYNHIQERFQLRTPAYELSICLWDWHAALHDNRITSPFTFTGDSGKENGDVTGRHGEPLAEMIRELLNDPTWNGISN